MSGDNKPTHGSCFCGQVEYEFTDNYGTFQYCHCSRCRKVTGSAMGASLFVPGKSFRWVKGEDQVGRFSPETTRYFTTAFCKNCGSTLPWVPKGTDTYIVPAGTLDDHPGVEPKVNIFCDSRAPWFKQPADLPEYAEKPPS